MGRIVAQTKVTNPLDGGKSLQCGMLVDTGAGALLLPAAWKEKLGGFLRSAAVELLLANGEVVRGEACAPVEIEIEGFAPSPTRRCLWRQWRNGTPSRCWAM